MPKTFKRVELASGVAIIALISGASLALAQMDAATDATPPTPTLIPAALGPTPAPAADPVAPVTSDALFRKVTIPAKGLYRFEAPQGSGIKLSIDGQLVIDASGLPNGDTGAAIPALISLTPGDHAIKIEGVDADAPDLSDLTFSPIGAEPQALVPASLDITEAEASELTVKNSPDLSPAPAPTAQAAEPGSGALPGMDRRANRDAFAIGGSSSQARKTRPVGDAPETGGAMAGGSDPAGGFGGFGSGGGTRMASAPANETSGTTTSSTGGTLGFVPSPRGSGTPGNMPASGAPGTPGAPGVPGTPVATPGLPTPSPTLPSGTPTVPTPETVRMSPLSPPTNPQLTQAVQLTSAGNVNNQVPSSGSTLFGAVMDNSMFNIVNVSVASSGRTTTVDVGPESGQFAVRLFPEDFASGGPVQVTLTGASTASDEDEADPTNENGSRLLESLTNYDIAYAAFSERQLREVMGRFWANHFHAVTKDTDMYQQNITDRAYFRDKAFGNFGDLLLYSARSPLMSQYLDNDQNRRGNLNENYGREILELSTVGVEAGYGPDDVIAVSRIFTGWGYERSNPNADNVAREYRFEFRPDRHDEDDKFIPFLNTTIAGRSGAAGVQEGEELVAILANHPSTRSRTCGKLVQLLVADVPPQSFVDACVASWAATGGEIEPMLRAILLAPAYVGTADYQRNKAKTPFEYTVSAIRAFGARPENADDSDFYTRFRRAFENAGESYLRFPVPTGLPEVSAAWLNSATMVASYNQLADVAERRQDYDIDLGADIADAGIETAEEVAGYLLTVATADQFTREEYEAVIATLKGDDGIFEPRMQDETRALERAMGLIVVLPSFQLQ